MNPNRKLHPDEIVAIEHRRALEHSLSWNEQKRFLQFYVDGSGNADPSNDAEETFLIELIDLLSRSSKEWDFTCKELLGKK